VFEGALPESNGADEVRSLRAALRSLHDVVLLDRHPWAVPSGPSGPGGGRQLRRQLVEAVAAMEPAQDSPDHKGRLRHQLLVLRYLDGHGIAEVAAALHVSRREYNRQHRHAVETLLSVLHRPRDAPLGGAPAWTAAPAAPLTSFVGRERQLAELRELLARQRCVSVLGPPGTGKTRLALEIHRRIREGDEAWGGFCPDGTVFVPLDAVGDPDHLVPALAHALGVRGSPDVPLLHTVADRVGEARILLTLDNYEHLTDAAPVVSTLVERCPKLHVLVTSRRALQLTAEHRYVVPPLEVPGSRSVAPDEALGSESVVLYADRARAASQGFALTESNVAAVVELCRRLDGLPLAIELAAARVRLLPPAALTDGRVDPLSVLSGGARDVPTRQQTLRNAIEWSVRLLTPDEAALLGRLSLFTGGWTLPAAQAVCSPLPTLDVADGLGRLLDHHLVQDRTGEDGVRFALLETIGTYARRELLPRTPSEVDEVSRRHAEYYLELGRQADAAMLGPAHATWMRRIDDELPNIRQALGWLRDGGRIDDALTLAASLQWFWFDGAHWREGQEWLDGLLASGPPSDPTPGRAWALAAAGACRRGLNDYSSAERLLGESIGIWRQLGRGRELGRALLEMSVVANARGDPKARSLTEEGLTHAREAQDWAYVGLALYGLGVAAVAADDAGTAEALFHDALSAWDRGSNRGMAALGSNALGDLARGQGRYRDAVEHYRASLAATDATHQLQAVFRHNLAYALTHLGDLRQARRLFADAGGRFRALGDTRGAAECLAGLAVTVADRQPACAAEAFAAAMRVISDLGARPSPSNRTEYDSLMESARRQLGDYGLQDALDRGRRLGLDRAEALLLDATT
jgi:non-specific serine/threonine protein kinase